MTPEELAATRCSKCGGDISNPGWNWLWEKNVCRRCGEQVLVGKIYEKIEKPTNRGIKLWLEDIWSQIKMTDENAYERLLAARAQRREKIDTLKRQIADEEHVILGLNIALSIVGRTEPAPEPK